MGYDENCCCCPYLNQKHLNQKERTCRPDPPVEVEDNGGDVLIVALAPGVEEWRSGKPLMPIKKKGGTAGRRVQKSWERSGKKREDFNIIEAVQCYPGEGKKGRDKEPVNEAVKACAERLRATLKQRKYRKAIALGEVAYKSLQRASANLTLNIAKGPHPTGGASKAELDALW